MKPNQFGGGTDIGTTYSAIAKAHNLESPAQLLEAKNGSHHIPSYVYYDQNERAQVGEIAINQEPTATVYDNKRFIGQTFNEVKHYIEDYPFKIIADPNSDYILYQLSSNGHEFTKTPLEVATDQLAHYHDVMTARVDMKNCIGMTGTHPAYFKSIQKFATLNAGMLFLYAFMFTYVNYSVWSLLRVLRFCVIVHFLLFVELNNKCSFGCSFMHT